MIRQFAVVQSIIIALIIIALAVSNQASAQNSRNGTSGQATLTTFVNTAPKTGETPYAYCYGANIKCTGSGCSQIKVKTPSDSDVLVTLKQNGRVVAHAYISANSTYTFQVPDGTYQPFFYYGRNWDSEKVMTQTDCGTLRGGFAQSEYFGKDTPEKLNSNVLTYELILQQNGNFSTIPSNQKEAF